jgi:hypothetical protein
MKPTKPPKPDAYSPQAAALQLAWKAGANTASAAAPPPRAEAKEQAKANSPEKNYGEHYAEYLSSGAAYGDGPSTVAPGYDDWALGKGYMTREQWAERAKARGVGAVIGIGVVATGAAGVEALAARAAMAEFQGLSASEIAAINKSVGGSVALTGDAETVIANMARREDFVDKVATAIRDIAGRHLFNDGNKRTAQAVAEELSKKNGLGLSAERIRAVVDQVAQGTVRAVEDISQALKGK